MFNGGGLNPTNPPPSAYANDLNTLRQQETKRETTKDFIYDSHRRPTRLGSNVNSRQRRPEMDELRCQMFERELDE